jgi:lysophospholipase L1-like esterase
MRRLFFSLVASFVAVFIFFNFAFPAQAASVNNGLFIGDSLTQGAVSSGLLSGALIEAQVGATAAYWSGQLSSFPPQPAFVFVLLGVNNPGDITGMTSFLDQLQLKYPLIPITVAKVLPVGANYSYSAGSTTLSAAQMTDQINAYNLALASHASSLGMTVVDVSTGLLDLSGTYLDPSYLGGSDNLHLNAPGYQILAQNMVAAATGDASTTLTAPSAAGRQTATTSQTSSVCVGDCPLPNGQYEANISCDNCSSYRQAGQCQEYLTYAKQQVLGDPHAQERLNIISFALSAIGPHPELITPDNPSGYLRYSQAYRGNYTNQYGLLPAYTDCSHFVSWVLHNTVAPDNPFSWGGGNYYTVGAFLNSPRVSRVASSSELLPGDLIISQPNHTHIAIHLATVGDIEYYVDSPGQNGKPLCAQVNVHAVNKDRYFASKDLLRYNF